MLTFFIFCFISIVLTVDPVGVIPSFLSITTSYNKEQKLKIAKNACIIACSILLVFTYFGSYVLKYLGISVFSLQLAGAIVLFMVALNMLKSGNTENVEDSTKLDPHDVIASPIAIPLLSGAASISNCIIL